MSKSNISSKSLTDWKQVDGLRDEDIDLSDSPVISPKMFANAIVRRGLKAVAGKSQITLRLDRDVLTWFRAQGPGYQTRINTLLRLYMEAHHTRFAKPKKGRRPA